MQASSELLGWINLHKNTTDKLRKAIEKTKALDLSRRRHLLIDEAAVQNDGEGCYISSSASTHEFKEVICTRINSKFHL